MPLAPSSLEPPRKVEYSRLEPVDHRARRTQLRHEDVVGKERRAAVYTLVGLSCRRARGIHNREIARLGRPDHVGVARGVNGDAIPRVELASRQARGIDHDRVDDQRLAAIVRADSKADLL
jgi:hypothetical protein